MSGLQAKSDRNAIHHTPHLRADAAWALYQVLEHGKSTRDVMPLVFARHHQAKDRAWLQETVFGVLRVLPTLQTWLRSLLAAPLKKQQKIIEHVMMIGLFQQAYMRTSVHAAVSETVNASKVLKQAQLSGMVNAVLRNFERNKVQEQAIDAPHAQANLPKWLYKQLASAYPEQLRKISTAMQTKAPLWLRVNLQYISIDDYSALLSDEGIGHDCIPPRAVKLHAYTDVTHLPLFEEGGFAVQDMAAQLAAGLLSIEDEDIVLDACAAPGGKTAALIEANPMLGEIFAIDSVAERNVRTLENLERLGHLERLGERLHVLDLDAGDKRSYEKLPQFNKILLDAPCSATGVIRRHPDIKWHRKASDIDDLVALQREILEQTWRALLPGGTLLYATCSILPQENTEQIKHFLADHADATLVPIREEESIAHPGWQILPGEADMDGFFYARLLKSH
jgi:16S rRNA (cytosine967-C5)-methyltransferase